MPSICDCHGVQRVYAGGDWRCLAKYKASQARYDASEKGKARRIRSDKKRDQVNTRLQVGSKHLRLPTLELKRKAQELKTRRLDEFKSRFASRAETEGAHACTARPEAEI